MNKSFQQLIKDIVARKYKRPGQHNSRVILNAYYSQSSNRRRSYTLDELGRLTDLTGVLTRERSRQILKNFRTVVLKKEIELLERGRAIDDPIMLSSRVDLSELRMIVESIVGEIESFQKPIFTRRLQDRLIRKGLVDKAIFLPVVAELAESFSIETSFKIEEFRGQRLILAKDARLASYTTDILTYAGRSATHLGGTCSFEALIGEHWDDRRPFSIAELHEDIRLKYIKDILSFNEDLMFLQNETFFSFKDRDERLSTILSEIFKVYGSAIDKDILMNALIRSLTHRFMTENQSDERDQKISLIRSSSDAFDEFCRRTLLLDEADGQKRKPGIKLIPLIENNNKSKTKTGILNSQILLVEAIRSNGGAVNSKEFGRIYRNELNLPESHKSTCYSYPTLFYKEGSGRRNDLYKTLDGEYLPAINVGGSWTYLEKDKKYSEIMKQIKSIQSNFIEIDEDSIPIGMFRKEQRLLRKYLIEMSDSIEMSDGGSSCKCQLCNRYFAAALLVAAHVKRRADCTAKEKADIENVAMLQCGGCDKLFENGYIFIDDEGSIRANDNAPLTYDVEKKLTRLDGNKTEYANGALSRIMYIKAHRDRALLRHS